MGTAEEEGNDNEADSSSTTAKPGCQGQKEDDFIRCKAAHLPRKIQKMSCFLL